MRAPLRFILALSLGAAVAVQFAARHPGGAQKAATPVTHAAPQLGPGDSIAAAALAQLDRPYRPGGRTPGQGFDCSGLVCYAYAETARPVRARSANAQAAAGRAVTRDEVAVGDVIAFAREPGGRYFHSGVVVHASADSLVFVHANRRHGVHRTRLGTSRYWSSKVIAFRRMHGSARGATPRA